MEKDIVVEMGEREREREGGKKDIVLHIMYVRTYNIMHIYKTHSFS